MADKTDKPAAPKINATMLYEIVADAMPMEGRDFSLDIAQGPDGGTKLSVKPLTDVGKMFAPILVSRLAKPMSASGVSVVGDGPASQEVLTVRSIRTKVEAEAEAARRSRIREAAADAKAKYEASQAARKARIAKAGEKSPVSQEELAASQALEKANARVDQLKRIDAAVSQLRVKVDAAAKAAAEKDAKTGRSWAVDMDAPLKTPFDRNDAIAKLSEKERLLDQMAAHAVDMDYLGMRAAK